MNNVGQKYLPIGSVVMLKGGSKRVMISGFCTTSTEEQNKIYDYSGCMFPEGFLSSEQTALFNHDQIEKIYFIGLNDEEEKQFKIKLNSLVAQMTQDTPTVAPAAPVAPVQTPQNITAVPPVGPGLPGTVTPVDPVVQASALQSATAINNFKFDE